jgi:hypothetical protein
MTVEEQILETLHILPPERQAEVLDFAEFLRLRLKPAPQLPAADLKPLPTLEGRIPPGWKDAIYDHR